MQSDLPLIPYDAPYASITDSDGGATWLFIAFEGGPTGFNTRRVLDPNYVPSAPAALAPLAHFGFHIHSSSGN